MNIGILIPGFGANEDDWALPVYQNFVRELVKSHDVRVITLRYPHTRQPYTYYGAQIYPLGWGAWTKRLSRLRLWWDTWRTVKRLHAEKPFDILHGIWADETGALSGWIGNALDVPSVVSIAGGELVGFPDIGYGLQISRYGRWIVRQALTTNTVVVSPYSYHLTCHLEKINLEEVFTQHIPLGVDIRTFFPSGAQRKPKHLISVGSLIPVKNQKMLLDALTMLDDDITLDIIGQGILEDELKQYVETLGISHRVKFLGNISHTQLREHYTKAQLLVHTSLHEAFCMVVLEAAACGTPAIGTHVGLIADDQVLARSVSHPHDLKQQIKNFLTDTHALENFRSDAYLSVKKNYTIEKITARYIDLYHNLL